MSAKWTMGRINCLPNKQRTKKVKRKKEKIKTIQFKCKTFRRELQPCSAKTPIKSINNEHTIQTTEALRTLIRKIALELKNSTKEKT